MYLHTALQSTANRSPAAEALVLTDGTSVSYQELQSLVCKCADQLRRLGTESDSRVGVYLPKHMLSAVAPFAISALGGVYVPINPLLSAAQVKHIATDCQLSALITSVDRAKRLEGELGNLRTVYLLSEPVEDMDILEASYDVWNTEAQKKDDLELTGEPKIAANEKLAALLYTSGSTGLPKGVMLSHQNLILGAQSVNEYLRIDDRDRILALLPFSFDYGLNQLVSAVVAGATCVLFDYLFPKDVLEAVVTHNVTGIAGVPALWAQLVNADSSKVICGKVRYVTNSGGHLPEAILKKLTVIFPSAKPFLMYGLTEAFRSTYLPPSEVSTRPESIGIPIPNASLFVVKDDGSMAEPGEHGQLVHVGPLVAMGYWNRPAETAKVFRAMPEALKKSQVGEKSPAVWSGDTVKKDEDGFLYFVGRRDAMIKTSGYRVSPEEIEEVFYQVEQVQSAAAIGIPDDVIGQAILVCIELKTCAKNNDPDLIKSELKKHCRRTLPSYLVPKEFVICDVLPKNANGKIDRGELFRLHQRTA